MAQAEATNVRNSAQLRTTEFQLETLLLTPPNAVHNSECSTCTRKQKNLPKFTMKQKVYFQPRYYLGSEMGLYEPL